MTTNIYFVRHAKSDFNVKNEVLRPLTDDGRKGAIIVSEFLYGKKIDLVYSSPYKRTIDTVQPFADKAKKEIILIDELKERKIGCWLEDFNEFSEKQWSNFDFKLENGESLNEVQLRNVEALNKILKECKGKNIIIGTHGTALSTIINHFDSSFSYNGFESIKHKMPFVAKFTFDESELKEFELIDII